MVGFGLSGLLSPEIRVISCGYDCIAVMLWMDQRDSRTWVDCNDVKGCRTWIGFLRFDGYKTGQCLVVEQFSP